MEPLEAKIILAFGKIMKVEKEPGLHFYLPILTTRHSVSLKVQTINVAGSSVPDARGSPMNCSAIVTYSVTKPVEALYHVINLDNFIRN